MKLCHVLTLLVSVSLFSCKKDREARIELGTKEVGVWAGQSTELPITGGAAGPYTATSSNEQVAKVTVDGARLLIATDMTGEAVITVQSAQRQTTTLKVRSQGFSGTWKAMGTTDAYKFSIEVESADAAFSASLKTQLQQEEERPGNAVMGYLFSQSVPQPTYRKIFRDRTEQEGTFSFRNLTLTIGSDVFRVIPMDGRQFMFEQDLTERYKALHPGKNITTVKIRRYYQMVMMPG